jgi:hypothetical protein
MCFKKKFWPTLHKKCHSPETANCKTSGTNVPSQIKILLCVKVSFMLYKKVKIIKFR